MSAEYDADDAVASLARIAQASVRLIQVIHDRKRCVDPEEEIDHMRSNLDRIEALMSGVARW